MSRHADDDQRVMQNDPENVEALLLKVKQFAEGQSATLDGGWPVVTRDDMLKMSNIIQDMIALRFEVDCDGSLPVEYKLIDRTRFEPMHFQPLPYDHEAESEDELVSILHTAELNLSMATSRFQEQWRMFEYRRRQARKEKEKGTQHPIETARDGYLSRARAVESA
jgi:hypothetical protein